MQNKYHALIPAAGSGSRMRARLPKQYLSLADQPMIYHAVRVFCSHSSISRVYVALSPEDTFWDSYNWSEFDAKLVVLHCGGETRAQTVRQALHQMSAEVGGQDWVLVHDAARPALDHFLLDKLIATLALDAVGGLLAVPVSDTLKRADGEQRVISTEPREGLWQAQTPQMFRHGQLLAALDQAGIRVTDEASAIEQMGLKPRLVESDSRNIKVTYPTDLELVRLVLESRNA